MPKSKLEATTFNLSINDSIEITKLKEMLVLSGYQSVDMVDGIGQFSVRGGILDVFPAGSENPVRIEFFGDDIDGIGPTRKRALLQHFGSVRAIMDADQNALIRVPGLGKDAAKKIYAHFHSEVI
jgi:excinuclease UvrABC helicase subunit UvrB